MTSRGSNRRPPKSSRSLSLLRSIGSSRNSKSFWFPVVLAFQVLPIASALSVQPANPRRDSKPPTPGCLVAIVVRRTPDRWRERLNANAVQLVDVSQSERRDNPKSSNPSHSNLRTGRREVILIFDRPWHISCAGRRRNVAQVRREALINQHFSANLISWVRCDDFLTTPLTSFDGRAYNPTTERGGAGAQRPRQASAPVKLLS